MCREKKEIKKDMCREKKEIEKDMCLEKKEMKKDIRGKRHKERHVSIEERDKKNI